MSKEKKLTNKELRDLLSEQGYTIEALEDEIEEIRQDNIERRAKLWEVIQENDRLTLTYEPYRPPGDEHEGLEFYGLIEENEELRLELNKMAEKNYQLASDLQQAQTAVTEKKAVKEPKKRIKNDRWWNFSVELWPGAWGLNYYRFNWKNAMSRGYPGTSREGQIQVGPFGFSWNREPKN